MLATSLVWSVAVTACGMFRLQTDSAAPRHVASIGHCGVQAAEPAPAHASHTGMQHHGGVDSGAGCCPQFSATECNTSSAAEGNAHTTGEWSQLVLPLVAGFSYLVFDLLHLPYKAIPPHRERRLEQLPPIFLLTQRLRI